MKAAPAEQAGATTLHRAASTKVPSVWVVARVGCNPTPQNSTSGGMLRRELLPGEGLARFPRGVGIRYHKFDLCCPAEWASVRLRGVSGV